MNIYSCVDNKNIDKIIVLFNSAYLNCKEESKKDLNFYLIIDSFPEKLPLIPDYLKEKIKIKEFVCDNKWSKILSDFNKNFYQRSGWCKSDMNFARFFIFKIFPEIDRVIYLDWDMIVLGNLFEIHESYLDKQFIIGAELNKHQTVFNNSFVQDFKFASSMNSLLLEKSQKYKNHKISTIMKYLKMNYNEMFNSMGFNAGFYIVSKIHFEEEYLTDLILKLIKIQSQLSCFNFGTQIVMNFMFINKKKFVPKVWNHLPKDGIDLNNLKIIHWNGLNKPWKDKKDNLNKIWWNYFNKIY